MTDGKRYGVDSTISREAFERSLRLGFDAAVGVQTGPMQTVAPRHPRVEDEDLRWLQRNAEARRRRLAREHTE